LHRLFHWEDALFLELLKWQQDSLKLRVDFREELHTWCETDDSCFSGLD